jgi:hypothetical protein
VTDSQIQVPDAEGAFSALSAEVASLSDEQRRKVLNFLTDYIPIAVGTAIDTVLGVAGTRLADEA